MQENLINTGVDKKLILVYKKRHPEGARLSKEREI